MALIDEQLTRYGHAARSPRWMVVGMVLLVLLAMGFYTATDPAHLTHSQPLSGADWMGYAVCHRITARSFAIDGRQLPLCARCTGMYLGVAVTFLAFFVTRRLRWSELPRLPILMMLMGFVLIMGIDGLNSYSHFFPNAPHLYTPRNWLRLLTGLGTGLAMGSFILPALAQTLWQQPVRQAPLRGGRDLAALLLAGVLMLPLVLSNQPQILYVLALVSTVGLLLLLAAINVVLGLIVLRRDARAIHWRQTAVPLLLGVLLAVVELSAISYLRYSFTGTMTGFPGL